MERTFDEDLRRELEDPEFAVGFANAQIESAEELLRCGIITDLNIGSSASKTKHISWRSE